MVFSLRAAVAVAVLLSLATAARAAEPRAAWHEGFEGEQPSWLSAGGEGHYRILQHGRIQGNAHSGNGCEWLQWEAGGGSRVDLAHDIGRPRIIEDLTLSLWVRSDRPGIRLTARIVLPHAVDPHTNQPMTAVVAGGVYTDVGRWQQLRIEQIPRLLTRQVHLLRMQFGPQVDDREAYLDALLLNALCEQGTTNLWIDDLDVAGRVPSQPETVFPAPQTLPASAGSGGGSPAGSSPGDLVPVRLPPLDAAAASAQVVFAPKHTVKLVESVLLVDGRPTFPRIIQHCGESLETLKKVGFNAVWLSSAPGPELLSEADRLGLWLVCPPPRSANIGSPTGSPSTLAEFGPEWDCVLAWNMGNDLTAVELEATRHWAEQVQKADRRGRRPLICLPRAELRSYSRMANLLLLDHRPVGTSMELTDYAAWLRRRPLLASLGTPVWTTVQTQPNEPLRRQLVALDPGRSPPLSISPEQIRLLVYTAVTSGSRGLLFASDSPLDATDPDSRQRAMTLELLNLELELIEPWAAASNLLTAVEASNPEVVGAVIRTNHSRLLLPLWCSPGAQFVPPQSAANALTLIAAGVPEATSVFELTPQGLHPIKHQYAAGGLNVTFNEFGLTALALMADDPTIIGDVKSRAAQIGARAAELHRHLAVHKQYTVRAVVQQIAMQSAVRGAAMWFDSAQKNLQQCDRQLAAGDISEATLSAERATRSLRLIERAYWNAAVEGLASPVTSPAAVSFDTLPSHWRLLDRLRGKRFSPNLLTGGDFEDVDTMVHAGWLYNLNAAPTVQASVDLTQQAAHRGQRGLRLAVTAADPKNPPETVENPPIRFSSPAVQVAAGQIVCIHGWVYVHKPAVGATDGLMIVDSLSGECLADRIGPTKQWRQFALYRVATQSGPMGVTFVLPGVGEAWIDDVEIQILED